MAPDDHIAVQYDREVDGRWIAESVDYPGCAVYGDTQEQATLNLMHIISLIAEA